MNSIRFQTLSITENSATFAYCSETCGFLELSVSDGTSIRQVKTQEAGGIGRLSVDGLDPDWEYSAHITHESGQASPEVNFKTLPAPLGDCLFRFTLISDPHLSVSSENRKGRLFIESTALLRDTLGLSHNLGAQLVLMPGDITNRGTPAEYQIAQNVLKSCDIPIFAVPGNHDIKHPEFSQLWDASFTAKNGIQLQGDLVIAGIDTSKGELDDPNGAILEKAISQAGFLCVMTHYQLFPCPYWNGTGGMIRNAQRYTKLLQRLAQRENTIIYCGHLNIPARVDLDQAIQVNLPQPLQYPCGFQEVRFYKNGLYHTFRPISSEVLREHSRRAGNMAVSYYQEKQWQSDYRDGEASARNFFVKRTF